MDNLKRLIGEHLGLSIFVGIILALIVFVIVLRLVGNSTDNRLLQPNELISEDPTSIPEDNFDNEDEQEQNAEEQNELPPQLQTADQRLRELGVTCQTLNQEDTLLLAFTDAFTRVDDCQWQNQDYKRYLRPEVEVAVASIIETVASFSQESGETITPQKACADSELQSIFNDYLVIMPEYVLEAENAESRNDLQQLLVNHFPISSLPSLCEDLS